MKNPKYCRSVLNILVFWLLGSNQVIVTGQEIRLQPFAGGLNHPVDIKHLHDARLYIVERPGRVRIVDSLGNVSPEPFLDIVGRVNSGGSLERGLLGMAFHPDYEAMGYCYVNYTRSDGNTVIARFTRSTGNADQLDPSSEFILLVVDQPFANHNGGQLGFGPDGYLYIGLGDGGNGGDPGNRAQNRLTLLGKMLRIDVNNGDPYSIPADNPFAFDDFTLDEIWALGLRNPWRFSFDRQTGDLYIADVGQDLREEVNFQPWDSPGGENYGWRCYEGNLTFNTNGCQDISNYEFPVFDYEHGSAGCSVTGGYVYRGPSYPALAGKYIYTDYCSGRIWALFRDNTQSWVNQELGNFQNFEFSTIGENALGELFVAALQEGNIYRIEDVSTSLEEIQENSGFVVFPNPATERIHLTGTFQGGEAFTLCRPGGGAMPVRPMSKTAGHIIFETGNIPQGLYFLQILGKDHAESVKVVIVN